MGNESLKVFIWIEWCYVPEPKAAKVELVMKFLSIGRHENLFFSVKRLIDKGHQLSGIVTDLAPPEYKIQIQDFVEFAKINGSPILISSDNLEIARFIETLGNVDIGVSVNHRRIINKDVIDLFPLGILNLHGGDLPRYRGNACQAWAIINGEARIGACVHKMMPDILDSGSIISRDYLDINDETKIQEVFDWFEIKSPDLFEDAIEKLAVDSKYEIQKSNDGNLRSHRCYERRPEDGRIKWEDDAKKIIRLINASGSPYPGAYTFLGDKKVSVVDATRAVLFEDISAIPGQVIQVNRNSILVACGDNQAVEIFKISINLEKNITPSKFLSSTRLRFH